MPPPGGFWGDFPPGGAIFGHKPHSGEVPAGFPEKWLFTHKHHVSLPENVKLVGLISGKSFTADKGG